MSTTWVQSTRNKAKILTDQIASTRQYIAALGGSDENFHDVSAQLFQHLEKLYSEELPLSNAFDKSDIIFRLEGPGITEESPRASIIANQLTKVRTQVTKIVKAISGVTSNHAVRAEEIDLGVAAMARGSLILGFTAIPPSEIDEGKGKKATILGRNDPVFMATKRAIREIGVVTKHVGEKEFRDRIAKEIPDPKVRDAAIIAVQEFSPTSQSGISSVSIGGREVSNEFKMLTGEDRTSLRRVTRLPVLAKRHTIETFVGTIREMDLDARRCELRQIVGLPKVSLRIAFDEDHAKHAKKWLDMRLQVVGQVDRSPDGTPRILMLHKIAKPKK